MLKEGIQQVKRVFQKKTKWWKVQGKQTVNGKQKMLKRISAC